MCSNSHANTQAHRHTGTQTHTHTHNDSHIDTHKNKKEYVGSFSQHVHQHVLLSHFTLPALGNVTAQQKFLYNVHKRGAEKQKDKERLREREKERKKD